MLRLPVRWRSLAAGLAARIRSAFRPVSLEELVVVLEVLAREHRFADIVAKVQRHRRLERRVRKALCGSGTTGPDTIVIRAAELIASGWIGVGRFDSGIVCDWLLPLLQRSTGRHLAKTALARYLVDRLAEVEDPGAVVKAIEAHIPPRSWSDYSNIRAVFSMKTWPVLRRHLVGPRLISELDLFVTSTDRREFWSEFNQLERHP